MARHPYPNNDATASRESRLSPLIITIFALYARAEGNWTSVASIIALMADLGVDSPAVRSAISRLKSRGVLCSQRRGSTAGYTLSPATVAVLAEGDTRIFEPVRATEDDGWVVVVYSVPESERDKRHALRSILTRLGFGTVANGVWIAPATMAQSVCDALRGADLATYVDLFTGQHLAYGDLPSKVARWWDLDHLSDLYTDFLRQYRSVLDEVTARAMSPQHAFQVYVPMLTQWRRLPYRDPGLPLRLLPPTWSGDDATALFDELNDHLRPLAHKRALTLIHGRNG
ncbi:PaaX family transcriptional regulator C-terminal domain-containing protein [Mycobacterium syngnathidarum]